MSREMAQITTQKLLEKQRENGIENFLTGCYGEINRYEWRPSGIIKKMNEGLYRVTHFTCDNKNI